MLKTSVGDFMPSWRRVNGLNEERKTILAELLLCRGLDRTQVRLIGFLLERKVGVGIDDWRFYFNGPNSKRLLHDIEVMRGFGLVELLIEKTPYDYNRLRYCLTEKGKRMLERILADEDMKRFAERLGVYIDALSMTSIKEVLEMVKKYE
jgi:uncharacterized protein YwgA